jgi:hypothetical protein
MPHKHLSTGCAALHPWLHAAAPLGLLLESAAICVISGFHAVSYRMTRTACVQNVNGEAKPYQIRQFLRLVERYNLVLEDTQ